MKVVFLQDVPGTADAGEVKEVKNGFARNYLIPRQLAAPATATHLQGIANLRKAAGERRLRETADMLAVAEKVKGTTVLLERKVGPTGRLYGSITTRHIAEEVSKLVGRDLEHRVVLLPQAIHEPGTYAVTLRLHRDVATEVTVSVVPEGSRPPQAAAGEAAAPSPVEAAAPQPAREEPAAPASPEEAQT